MAAAKVDVKTLGHSGVIIDPNPLEPSLPDDSLRSAQNASHDPTLGYGGGLRKRPGLLRFNAAWAGGAILGGIPMAVAGTGGAPTTGGGGSTGDSTGGGDGTGAPGGTSDGSSVPSFGSGAGGFGGGSLFGGARLIVVGRSSNANNQGVGWYVDSAKFGNTPNIVLTPGPPQQTIYPPVTTTFPYAFGFPGVYHAASGFLFYCTQPNIPGGAAVTIRKTNGASDAAVAVVPTSGGLNAARNSASNLTIALRLLTMHAGSDGSIYITVCDKSSGFDTTGSWGAVFKLNPSTGLLTQLNVALVPGTAQGYAGIPYTCAFFNGYLYWGEHNLTAAGDSQKNANANIYGMTSDQTYAIIDHGFSDGEVVGCMYPFPQTAPSSNPSMDVLGNQIMFCGFGSNKTIAAFSLIYSRARLAPGVASAFTSQITGDTLTATVGVTANTNVSTTSGGTAQNGNYFSSMVQFGDNLYAAYFNPTQKAKIYKFAPDFTKLAADGAWDGSGTWSVVYTNASAADRVPFWLFVDNGVMYAIGGASSLGTVYGMWTVDGSTWTSGSLPDNGINSAPMPILAGFNQ